MTQAREILKLIEEADPSDTAKLDELDAKVWCYLNGHKFAAVDMEGDFGRGCMIISDDGSIISADFAKGYSDVIDIPKYTRSRDALKQIRPAGWYLTLMIDYLGKASYRMSKSGIEFHSAPYFQEERLAELHANIIAIDHERSQP